ncbi:hypothetical protein [Lentzea flava]|uniref:Uncharacterized protein n=1 Tax=Lentzea flava TaxID=103732 RepID=A0ABQ2UG23_9PSEU|nr:hypothetical protein [Lentzea flava]GGU31058.1 hypothetical protein GCM10010178_24180 [Lentzea flava]
MGRVVAVLGWRRGGMCGRGWGSGRRGVEFGGGAMRPRAVFAGSAVGSRGSGMRWQRGAWAAVARCLGGGGAMGRAGVAVDRGAVAWAAESGRWGVRLGGGAVRCTFETAVPGAGAWSSVVAR